MDLDMVKFWYTDMIVCAEEGNRKGPRGRPKEHRQGHNKRSQETTIARQLPRRNLQPAKRRQATRDEVLIQRIDTEWKRL
jgi:hypothetical protein